MTLVGSKVLHYQILQEIGAGGMGVVYLAEDEKLHRRVALKFLARTIQDDPAARERLIREARAASALNHPHIVAIHAIESTPEHVFIVMEYVEGESIHSLVKRGEMTWRRALEIAPQVLSALATAHDAGIVHRDIKSDNIFVTSKGQANVLDFGLARGHEAAATVTRTGSSAGTPAYMSPEQVQDGVIDQRSDLFSFGVVLYEMLAGRIPFKGEHEAALAYSIVNESPAPIKSHNPAVPHDVQNVVSRLLEKNPRDRYQSAAEVQEDLRRIDAGQHVTGPHRARQAMLVALVAAIVASTVGWWALRDRSSHGGTGAESERKMLAVLPFENLGPAEQEYFADGITEDIRTQLAKLSGMGVISRTSAMKYKGSTKSLREIGKELGIDYALEGSVRWEKAGDRNNVRITAQLIGIDDDAQLWGDTFDREFAQIFTLQSEIAEKVANELNITLLEPERAALEARPTKNLDAYDLYLKGRETIEAGTSRAEIDAGLAMIEQATQLDSTFARANAYLARSYSNQYFNQIHPELPRLAQARTAALAALRHSPNLGHVAMGYYHYYGSRDYKRALEEFALAEKVQPNNADVYEAMGYVQRRQGKWEESVENLERAMAIDPKTDDRIGNLVQTLIYMRRWDDAERWLQRGLDNDPNSTTFKSYQALLAVSESGDAVTAADILQSIKPKNGYTARFLAECYTMQRQYQKVHEVFPRISAYSEVDTTMYYASRSIAYHFQGETAKAHLYADSARVFMEKRGYDKLEVAQILAGYAAVLSALGRNEEALRYINHAVELMPVEKDALAGADVRNARMIIYLTIRDFEAAIREIQFLMSVPSGLTPAILRVHPGFDEIRDDPRFKKLAEGKVSS